MIDIPEAVPLTSEQTAACEMAERAQTSDEAASRAMRAAFPEVAAAYDCAYCAHDAADHAGNACGVDGCWCDAGMKSFEGELLEVAGG
jgi:hypothetical protein